MNTLPTIEGKYGEIRRGKMQSGTGSRSTRREYGKRSSGNIKGENVMQHININQQPATASGTFTIGGDLTVYRLGFGAMRLTGPGIWGLPANKQEAIAVLRRALDLGVNLIDTADSYGPEVAESLIAEALYPYPKDLVIATKGGLLRTGPNQWPQDGRPAHLRKALE